MATNVYIVSVAPRSGQSVIALGVMELLARRTRKIGFFRPIVPEGAQGAMSDNSYFGTMMVHQGHTDGGDAR